MTARDDFDALRDAVGRPLRIGLSARIFHADRRRRDVFRRTLQILEQSIAHWVLARHVMVLMVPSVLGDSPVQRSDITLSDYAGLLDGLILQGGADVSPSAYGCTPLSPAWAGDPIRDAYELELLQAFIARGKPVFGICRGMQLINVAFGGTLCQDLPSLRETGERHESDHYDRNLHPVVLTAGGLIDAVLGAQSARNVVSIHHQAVDRLGAGLVVEAVDAVDGTVEAIRLARPGAGWVLGVQWHPEFHPGQGECLDCDPLLDAFLARAAQGALARGGGT